MFRFFAADAEACAGVRIRIESIESCESPEPDIRCDIEGCGTVAFELSEILDQESMKLMATMMSARQTLLAHTSTLPPPELNRLSTKLSQKQIKVAFRHDRPLRELNAAVSRLYRWLIDDMADDLYGYSVPVPSDLLNAIEYVSILFPGPADIDIAFGLNIIDATISTATRKLVNKTYATSAPIELLVYAHDQPLIAYEQWRPRVVTALVPLIDISIARGHIRRVWIYDISRRKTADAIRFVYPKWES